MAQDFDLSMPTERSEKYLAKMAKVYDGTLPEPISNIDRYLKLLAENDAGGGSGGITPKPLENADLNTVTETGFYYADFDHTCKNVPSKVGSYGFSIIVTNGGGVVYQLLMKNTIDEKNRLFMRVIDSDGEVYPWSNYMQESDVTVDSVLSETSTRPPQNAIVTKRLNEIQNMVSQRLYQIESTVFSDSGWTSLTGNSKVVNSFSAKIRKNWKFVEIRGDFSTSNYSSGSISITTIPNEFRPKYSFYFPVTQCNYTMEKYFRTSTHIDHETGNIILDVIKNDGITTSPILTMSIHVMYMID